MYLEDELLPISALQHLLYCERQCALIHIERAREDQLRRPLRGGVDRNCSAPGACAFGSVAPCPPLDAVSRGGIFCASAQRQDDFSAPRSV